MSRLLTPHGLVDALVDPMRRERTAVIVLTAYACVWTLYGVIAKGTQDLHFDMAEIREWSQELDWGYAKHPPFAPWLVRAWFTVVPFTDGTYYLLASIAATVGLWFAWKVAGLYLDPQKRVLGLVMLMLVPFYNFHALKFNANTVLTPLWAATTWWFLKSLETRAMSYALLAGLAAGMAILGKYWSGVLIIALFFAAFSYPHRKEYFSSWAPWVTGTVGTLAFLPHLAWLVTHDFSTLAYAKASRMALTYGSALQSAFWYLPKVAAYVAAPVLMLFAATRPSMISVADTVWPKDGTRRALLIAFAVPHILPVLIALAAKSEISALWAIPAMTLLPVVLLSSPQLAVTRLVLDRIVLLAMVFPLAMLSLSPLVAFYILKSGSAGSQAHYGMLAADLEKHWNATIGKPLRFVGGDPQLAYGVSPYLPDQPLPYVYDRVRSTIERSEVVKHGIVLLCVETHAADCREDLKSFETDGGVNADTQTWTVSLARRVGGFTGPPKGYFIVSVPPRSVRLQSRPRPRPSPIVW
jgi:hypothetical protein